MPFINDHVVLQELDEISWKLLEPLEYQGRRESFTVPASFQTDLASVPPIFTWLIPKHGKYTKAAILHDYLCVKNIVNRSDADGLFRRSMRELGVPFWRRWVMWAAVRLGSSLEAANVAERLIWLLVAVPTILFLLVPTLVVGLWLVLVWLLELVLYGILRPTSQKKVNRPHLLFGEKGTQSSPSDERKHPSENG